MPLDHYISQVHLKNFYSPKLKDLMYAIRKSDLKLFTPKSESVCRIEANSTNPYLSEPRIIEGFLKEIEPYYNPSIKDILDKNISNQTIYTISGFIAYVLTCSPAGMRLQSKPLQKTTEEASRRLDAQGKFPNPPSSLGANKFTELLDEGKVKIKIDPKYPQAMGINGILSHIKMFGNFRWEILINNIQNSPFFTSDFPIAIELTDDPRIINRIIPLSPRLAIKIHPNIHIDRDKADFNFADFKCRYTTISKRDALHINRQIVRCAESVVFYQNDHDWIFNFVAKNALYHLDNHTDEISIGDAKMHIYSLIITDALEK